MLRQQVASIAQQIHDLGQTLELTKEEAVALVKAISAQETARDAVIAAMGIQTTELLGGEHLLYGLIATGIQDTLAAIKALSDKVDTNEQQVSDAIAAGVEQLLVAIDGPPGPGPAVRLETTVTSS